MTATQVKNCWDHIGVGGDRSCEELLHVTHCRNCSVYAAAGRALLEREAPAGYLQEWTEVLGRVQPETLNALSYGDSRGPGMAQAAALSVMVVRLGEEWLGLPVRSLQEVTPPCIPHTLPHRTNALFRGLVNIRGEILLCISLKDLLGLEESDRQEPARKAASQMVVLAREGDRWVFAVDEVCGFHRCNPQEMQPVPVVVSKASVSFTQSIFEWQGHAVNFLDLDRLFHTLNRRIL